jgi:hypothetical protein
MRIAVLGSSPIMLIAASFLVRAGHFVSLFEERPVIGGAWIAPRLFGLKHRHANLIVAYNDKDIALLDAWKDFLLFDMGMIFEPVPNNLISISTNYHTSFMPDFSNAYISFPLAVNHTRVERVSIDSESLQVNGQKYDYLLLPAFSSMRTFIVNGVSYDFPFDEATSVHVICQDHNSLLPYIYLEGNTDLFDRYFKRQETGAFVARVKNDSKNMPRSAMVAKITKQFRAIDIFEYTSYYRNPVRFVEFKELERMSKGRIRIIDTRQFCYGLQDLGTLETL